jgi:hypothetical protein
MVKNTIKVTKSGICVTINGTIGVDHAQNQVIVELVKSLTNHIPQNIHRVPDWNQVVVLRAMMKPPFEPLKETTLRFLTMKTLFLLAWASAGRHALTVIPGHSGCTE